MAEELTANLTAIAERSDPLVRQFLRHLAILWAAVERHACCFDHAILIGVDAELAVGVSGLLDGFYNPSDDENDEDPVQALWRMDNEAPAAPRSLPPA